jgi:predicted NBD/HSP70 family sugar kinase
MARDLRKTNQRSVLRVLLNHLEEGVTQPDLERATELSRASVAAIMKDLAPVLRSDLEGPEAPTAPSKGGRPAKLFFVRDDIGAAAIDFGRSHVRVAVRSLRDKEPTISELGDDELDFEVRREPDLALDRAAGLLRGLLTSASAPARLGGICIGLATPMNMNGRSRMGPFHNWTDLDLAVELRERLDDSSDPRLQIADLDIQVENDANLALKGEYRWGKARGRSPVVYVKWATGIGAATIVNSQLVRGVGGVAGEFGHTVVPGTTGGDCDWCGHHCLESTVSSEKLWPKLSRSELVDIAEDPAHREHKALQKKVSGAATLIGEALAPVVNVLNPSAVIIGGLGPESFPDMCVPAIEEALRASVFPSVFRDVSVFSGSHKGRGVVVGGLAAVFDRLPDYLLDMV